MRGKIFIASFLLVVVVVGIGGIIVLYDRTMYPLNYKDEILSAGREFSVNSALVASIINSESRFRADAISNKGAVGLMQVMPSTAEWVAKEMVKKNKILQPVSVNEIDIKKIMYNSETKSGELLDPATNIRIGTFYLSYLLKKFNNLELALCAYNAGEGTVNSWLANTEYSKNGEVLNKIPYKETENYVEKVKRNLKIYTKKIIESG